MARQSRWQRYVDAAVRGPGPVGRGSVRHGPAGAVPPPKPRRGAARPAQPGVLGGHGVLGGLGVLGGPGRRAVPGRPDAGPRRYSEGARRTDLRLVPAAVLVWATAAAAVWLDPVPLGGLCGILLACSTALLLHVARACGRSVGPVVASRSRRPSGRWRRGQVAPRSRLATVAVGLLLSAVAGSHSAAASVQRHDSSLAGAAEARASVAAELVITGAPRRLRSPGRAGLEDRWAVPATLTAVDLDWRRIRTAAAVLVMGGPGWDRATAGQRIRTTGKLGPPELGGVEAAVLSVSSKPRTLAAPNALQQGAGSLRRALASAALRLGGDGAGLLPGMVTGDTSALDPELEVAMKAVGMTHLTAVSGANCSLILGVFLLGARSLRLSRAAATAVCLAGLGMFVLIVGPDASVLRAAVMGAIGLASLAGGRTGGALSLLCLAVITLLLVDPSLATSFGFLLSVLATLGIVVAGRPIMAWLPQALPRWAAAGIAVPLAAQAFCGPVIVLLQPQFTTYALAANLTASALVPPVTLLGTAAVPLLPFFPAAATAPLAVAAVFAAGVAGIARFFAGLPGAVLPWPEGPFGMVTMAVFSVGVLVAAWLVLHPAGAVALAVAAQVRTVAVIAALGAGARADRLTNYGRRPRTGQSRRGLVDRCGRGTLRVCKQTFRRKHEWLLPRPNEAKPPRRTPPPGGT